VGGGVDVSGSGVGGGQQATNGVWDSRCGSSRTVLDLTPRHQCLLLVAAPVFSHCLTTDEVVVASVQNPTTTQVTHIPLSLCFGASTALIPLLLLLLLQVTNPQQMRCCRACQC